MLPRIRAWFVWLWDQFTWLEAAAVPWLAAVLGGALLVLPDQTKDLMVAAQETDAAIAFGVAALFWSFNLWYWARWGVTLASGDRPGQSRVAAGVPRAIAVLASASAAYAAWRSGAGVATGLAVAAAAMILVLAFLRTYFRRDTILNADANYRGAVPIPRRWLGWLIWDDLRAAPFGRAFSVGLLVVCLVGEVAFAAFPLSIADVFNAPVVVLLALAFMTALGAFVTRTIAANTRIPLLTIVVLIAVLFPGWVETERRVRTQSATAAFTERPTIDKAAEAWLGACAKSLADKTTGRTKVVLVGTAGGASRAAVWTLRALHELSEQDPLFAQRTFAVSSVSGGSLGAALWVAMLARDGVTCATTGDEDRRKRRDTDALQAASADFITPTVAAMLSRDVVYATLLPVNVLVNYVASRRPADRTAVLESAWEAAWPAGTPNLLAGALQALWEPQTNGNLAPRPLLLLNGTLTGTGLPALTAPVKVTAETFPATSDIGDLVRPGQVRVSTGVSDSARFPLVSTQGKVTGPDGKDDTIADGGYFDNLGASTLINAEIALRTAYAKLTKSTPLEGVTGLDIAVVEINSDPTKLGAIDDLMRCGQDKAEVPPASAVGEAMNDALLPVLTVIGTQSGHTFHRLVDLHRAYCPPTGETASASVRHNYAVLSLCDKLPVSLPLNWVLPQATLEYFAKPDLAMACGNGDELGRISGWK